MNKKTRQELILKLVSGQIIDTQEGLREALCAEGCEVTQATLSRDIRELDLIKAADGSGKYRYRAPSVNKTEGSESAALYSLLADAVVNVDYAMNTVVVKCMSGMAQAVCAMLDVIELENLVGTLAGDDTIFILMRTEADARLITKEFSAIITK